MLAAAFTACKKDEEPKDEKPAVLTDFKGESGLSYNESIGKWNELKTVNGNSYIYQTRFVSWTGQGSTTEIVVIDGEVITRSYYEFKPSEAGGEEQIIDSYTENGGAIGSNEKGAAPLTVDELYTTCASDYLVVDATNNTLYFETDSTGLMTLCGFVPDGCADDCYSGVSITGFDWIK